MTVPTPDRPPTGPPGRWEPTGFVPPAGYAPPPPPGYPAGHPHGFGYGYPPPAPPALSPGGQPLAEFWERLLAYLIDVAVLAVVSMVVTVPAMFVVFFMVLDDMEVRPDGTVVEPDLVEFFLPLLLVQAVLLMIILGMYYIYAVEMMFRNGQTLGKRAMRLRIVPLDPAGTLTRAAAARRYLVQHVAGFVIPLFNYLDGLWQLWDKPYRQCLHDRFARTVVIKVVAR